MSRPLCRRTISQLPAINYFKPAGIPLRDLEEVLLEVDEFEAIRLADCERLYHLEAATRMGISRQTFDRILRKARSKVACALTRGYALRILTTTEKAKGSVHVSRKMNTT